MNNNLTDNEIKKALECCITDESCKKTKCPLYENGCEIDIRILEKFALDLINRLQTKNSNLTSDLTSLQNNLTSLKAEKEVFILAQETLQERIDFLEAENYALMEDKEKLKAKNESLKNAYKQCAWERDAYIEIENTAIAEAKAEAYTEFAERLKEKITEKYNYFEEQEYPRARITDIDNLLKEMVGDNE